MVWEVWDKSLVVGSYWRFRDLETFNVKVQAPSHPLKAGSAGMNECCGQMDTGRCGLDLDGSHSHLPVATWSCGLAKMRNGFRKERGGAPSRAKPKTTARIRIHTEYVRTCVSIVSHRDLRWQRQRQGIARSQDGFMI